MQTFYIGLTFGVFNLILVLAIMHLGSGNAPLDQDTPQDWQSLIDRIRQESDDDPL